LYSTKFFHIGIYRPIYPRRFLKADITFFTIARNIMNSTFSNINARSAIATDTRTSLAVVPAVGRLLMAAIFILSAVGKLSAPTATISYIEAAGLPFASLALAIAVLTELGGGVLLIIGVKARIVAAGLAVFSIVTGLVFHHAIGDQNQLMHLLKNFAMAGGLLQVVAFGSGKYSFDSYRAGR
jgi:putative oxidoreductase